MEQGCLATFKEMTRKEVINICDGKKLGSIFNAEIDLASNKIIAYLVKERKVELFAKKEKIFRIYVRDIKKIGTETILIEKMYNLDDKC